MSQDPEQVNCAPSVKDEVEGSRREFLKKTGRFAVYTPPAITLLMYPSAEAVASGRSRRVRRVRRGRGHGRGWGRGWGRGRG